MMLILITLITITTAQNEYILRYLQTTATLSPICSKPLQYQTTSSTNTITIKRLSDNMYLNDGFIMTDNISFSTKSTSLTQTTWDVKLLNLGVSNMANMFLGLCVYNTASCGVQDYYNHIVFSGLSILYHSTDCYHIEHHYNNIYWTTPRHCLSLFELLNLDFRFDIGLIGNYINMTVNYDSWDYYFYDQIWLSKNELTGEILDMASPCVILYVKDSSLQMQFP
jgi:hypothetical protein